MTRNTGLFILFIALLGLDARAQVAVRDTLGSSIHNDTLNHSAKQENLGQKILVTHPAGPTVKLSGAEFSQKLNKSGNIDSLLSKRLKLLIPAKIKTDLTLEDATQYQPLPDNLLTNQGQTFANKFYIRGNVLAWGIPLNFNFSNDHSNLTALSNFRNSLFKFDYNPSQANSLLKSDLQQYDALKRNAFFGLDLTTYTQQVIRNKLNTETGSYRSDVQQDALEKYLAKPENVTGLLNMNEQEIRVKLKSAIAAEKPDTSKNLVIAPLHKPLTSSTLMSTAKQHHTNTQDSLLTDRQADSVARTITTLKAQLKNEGIDVNKTLSMQEALKAVHGDISASELTNSYASLRPENSVQSLLTGLQSFKLGSFGNNAPGSTQQSDLFVSGTHLTYKTGLIPITLGYGSLNDIASAKDANYNFSDYNAPRSITYASFKVNHGALGNSQLSIIGSIGSGGSNFNSNYTVPTSPSNNVDLTISKLFNAGDLGKLSVDVSKSTTLFYSNVISSTDDILNRKSGFGYTGNDLVEAFSFGATHQLNLPKAGLTENVYFNYSGSAYQNPGNNGPGGGGLKLGENIKKSLFKNKITVTLKTDLDNKSISYTSSDQWRSYQVQLDTRYIVSRKFNVTLKYLNGGTDKQIDGSVTPVYSSQKYQVDGNLTYKIGKNYTVSHLTIGKQDYNNTYIAATGSSLLMINYTQSLLLKRNSLTASVFYNKELTSSTLIGNLLNSDLTYQYTIFQKINLASAVTYLDNAGIARQAGIRQSIQLLASKHFDMNTYVDLRHNIITSAYPDLYASCRAELSLKYHLTN